MEENAILYCRVCLKGGDHKYSIEDSIVNGNADTFLKFYNLLTNLNAQLDDSHPKKLCIDCVKQMKIAYDVRTKAIESDKRLRECYENTFDNRSDNDTEGEEKTKNPDSVEDETWELEYTDENTKFDYEDCYENQEDNHDDEAEEIPSKPENNSNGEGSIDLNCEFCDESFTNLEEWHEHVKEVHKTNNAHLCNICGKTYLHKMSLEAHLLQHKGEKPFKCSYCDKSYFSKSGLQTHLSTHKETIKPPKFLCSICGRSFATNQRLDIHTLMHTGEKKYQCNLCPKKFGTIFRLKTHARIHTGERPFECTECGLKFAQSNALKCHLRRHTGEKPFECKICGKRFNQNTILKTHMTLHTGKTVQCPQCDKKFSRPSYLILHQRDHTGEKPYACHKCPNRYKQKSHLDRHLDTHLGIKHKCPDCGKEYSKKSSLNIHRFEHSERKPYQCDYCQESFIRRDKFKNHLKKFHNKLLVNDKIIDDVQDNAGTEDDDDVTDELRGAGAKEVDEVVENYIGDSIIVNPSFCKEENFKGVYIEHEITI